MRGILIITGAVPVAHATTGLCPSAADNTAIVKCKLDGIFGIVFTVEAGKGFCVEIVPLAVDFFPTANRLTEFYIMICIGFSIKEQACVFGLALVDAGFAEVVVVAVDFVDTGELLAVLVVGVAAFFYGPAFFEAVH